MESCLKQIKWSVFIFCTNFLHRLNCNAECERSECLDLIDLEKKLYRRNGYFSTQPAPPLQDRKRGILMIRTVDIYRSKIFLKNIN
ncbi:hypothetical protein T10_13218 [Trichinella papuae]|uniref:Uncharacterized protein n=1 Tax=Trichinella papuae TaxID=268474 RepID=A0A0V1N457_9BILA|nr:hypothetical protein T10_13218 [Trichinella papuae]